MNTATRLLSTSTSRTRSRMRVQSINFSSSFILLVILLLGSALAVVYLKDLNRRLFIEYQELVKIHQQAEVERSKLLLEQSTWSTQERILSAAGNQLGMSIPSRENIVVVESQ